MKDYKEPKMETVELKEEALEEVNGGVLICDKFEAQTNGYVDAIFVQQ